MMYQNNIDYILNTFTGVSFSFLLRNGRVTILIFMGNIVKLLVLMMRNNKQFFGKFSLIFLSGTMLHRSVVLKIMCLMMLKNLFSNPLITTPFQHSENTKSRLNSWVSHTEI
ncbi:uncharacterized protein DC041_0008946 [Schistosoma bovis]|uniref:Uncharacterized protein n=1 Tax=Schistosoma bovis TaxID=6184 RepID=A0A430QMD4_SCHBO|nr:uncharacterized protein DC041_0008946 [Schistosoma bovis]